MRFPPELLQQCWFLTGPTASGKTEVSLRLAGLLDAEIVLLDSMTLYRGMDIGTAKPTPADRAQTPHHLVDILDPAEEFSVAEYLSASAEACRDIMARGRTPLFVGGTALYLRSVLRGVFEGPAAHWELRKDLEQCAAIEGMESVHARLEKVDPIAAARLPAADLRRVIRAIEVFELTGRPLSEQQREKPLPESERPPVFWLSPPRAWLHERIHRRVEAMCAEGLIREVQFLLQSPRGLSRTAQQGLGYKETIEFLQTEDRHVGALIETIQTRTRQFAKRQTTWFRNLVECRPVEMQGTEPAEALAERIVQQGRRLHGN